MRAIACACVGRQGEASIPPQSFIHSPQIPVWVMTYKLVRERSLAIGCMLTRCPPLKGKEIIEYYLRQLEEEGITFVPRWSPPPLGPSSDTCSASKSQATSAAVLVPAAAACREGLSGDSLGSPGTASEPVVGTPDGEPGPAEENPWAFPLSMALPSCVSSGSPFCTEEKVCLLLALPLTLPLRNCTLTFLFFKQKLFLMSTP